MTVMLLQHSPPLFPRFKSAPPPDAPLPLLGAADGATCAGKPLPPSPPLPPQPPSPPRRTRGLCERVARLRRACSGGGSGGGGGNAAAAAAAAAQAHEERAAMRYYRLWLHTCSAALATAATALGAALTRVMADPRRPLLLPSPFTAPSLLAAIGALLAQAAVLPALGCVAAARLSPPLLRAYWLMLVALLLGDALLGAVWLASLPRLRADTRAQPLARRLRARYGVDAAFTAAWDALQRRDSCCGVTGPRDFNVTSAHALLPPSCCASPPTSQHNDSASTAAGLSPSPAVATAAVVATPGGARCADGGTPWTEGCAVALQRWLRNSSDVLLVLGYCVLTFLKLCFAGILRCELREMISKIRLLRGEAGAGVVPLLLQQSAAGAGAGSIGGGGNAAVGMRGGTGPPPPAGPGPPQAVSVAGPAALCDAAAVPLLPLNGCVAPRPLLLVQADAAEDSDTNSNSALLLADDAGGGDGGRGGNKGAGTPGGRGGPPSNGNNNTFELREFNRMLARHGGRL